MASETQLDGPHKCNIHPEFEPTYDQEEWNRHCSESHSTTGYFACAGCGTEIFVENIPYQPIGKDVSIKCPSCYGQQEELQQMVLNQINNVQQGGEERSNE